VAYTRFDWEREIGECETLSPNAHHVALTLGNWIHSHKLTGFATQDDISRRMKRSRKHLNRGLSELEAAGWIQRNPGAPGRATTYRAVIPTGVLTKPEAERSLRQQALDFVHVLCRAVDFAYWNDPDFIKTWAPLVIIIEEDLESGLLGTRRDQAMGWCLRPLPETIRTLSGLFYSRYVEWRNAHLNDRPGQR
jgi:DNA-binding MarR family transcriptional regulator